jgi:ABC-type lipoprotein export system ATPase subunit
MSKILYTEEIETHELSKVSLDIFSKEYVSIEWPSGYGKSTLLSILLPDFILRSYPKNGSRRIFLTTDH